MKAKHGELKRRVCEYLKANPKQTGMEIQLGLGMSKTANIYPTLGQMVKKGVLTKLRNKKYYLTPLSARVAKANEEYKKDAKRLIGTYNQAEPTPLERILQYEIESIEAGIDSLMITKSYLQRRIEQVRADAKSQ